MDLDDYPDLLHVAEAARVLRVSRSSAYAYARLYERSDGREGLPVIRIGGTLRVPKAVLRRLVNGEASLTALGPVDAA
jgi:hypothetical protein